MGLALSPGVLGPVLVVVGFGLAAIAARSMVRRARDRRHGALVAVDRPGIARSLRSDRFRLVGRPDALRQLSDGRLVPVEIKRRASPRGAPPASHLIQISAYCLLVEETTGAAPPYGLLRYSDGVEFRVPWDRPARQRLHDVRRRVDSPYDGSATPSRPKCAACRWHDGCDARAR